MEELWSTRAQYRLWARVETAAAQAQGLDEKALEVMRTAAVPTEREVADEEARTRHDVVAFLNCWRRNIALAAEGRAGGGRAGGGRAGALALAAVHRGMTSSDLVDSANAIRWRLAGKLVTRAAWELTGELARAAMKNRETRRVARTHGQWAEESTLGHWLADKALMAERATQRLARATREVGRVKLSGPVGDYKRISRGEELEFAKLLGMRAADSSLQVVSRDLVAEMVWGCEGVAAAAAAVANEVRLGAQSGIDEIRENFDQCSQWGSSSMPHKSNPVTAEQMIGLYNIVKGMGSTVQSGVVLWGERDISHSSVERVVVPTATTLAQWAAIKCTNLIRQMGIDKEAMERNLETARNRAEAAAALTWLQDQGVETETAWRLVRRAVAAAEETGEGLKWTLPRTARSAEFSGVGSLERPNWARMTLQLKPRTGHLWLQIESLEYRTRTPLSWDTPS